MGITRHSQIPTRWIDQGATQGLPIFKVATRKLSGLIEIELAKFINDKTHWQAMLKGHNDDVDLVSQAATLIPLIEQKLQQIAAQYDDVVIERLDSNIQAIQYPIEQFPVKVKSHNFDKVAEVSGILQGIKGQYLLFDTGVINIRKFGSYEVKVSHDSI